MSYAPRVVDGPDPRDPDALRDWLADALARPVTNVVVGPVLGGHANGALGAST